MNDRLTLGIDLGGTNIKLALLNERNEILHRHRAATNAQLGFDAVFGRLVNAVRELLAAAGDDAERVTAVGYGNPGPLSHEKGIVYASPNLPGWDEIHLRDKLEAEINLPVTLENDANAAAYGEFVAGAGADVRDMVLLTLGTGVGAGIIIDSQLLRGAYDAAAEIGHSIVVLDGRPCPCGQRGCLERYSSANAVGERYEEAARAAASGATPAAGVGAEIEHNHTAQDAGHTSALAARVRAGERASAVDVEHAAKNGDPLAQRIWDDTCRYLALGCVNIQHTLNPTRIVLGGGLIAAGDFLLEAVQKHFDDLTWQIADDHPQIKFATLGNDAGVIGAAALARREYA